MKQTINAASPLELVAEAKIRSLLGNPVEKRFEASGVCVHNDACYVIFDNTSYLIRFNLDSLKLSGDKRMFPLNSPFSGYEDIAHDARTNRFFTLIEAQKTRSGRYKAKIEEYDNELNFLSSNWAEFPFKHKNKGLEGLAIVYLDEQLYLLGLCEGNKCRGGATGRKPGHGRIQVFKRGKDVWTHVETIKLPKTLRCSDYASLDILGHRIAVVSQASSLLWLGTIKNRQGDFADQGEVYRFPVTHKHKSVYCNIEGIAWLSQDLILAVSDKRKRGKQAKRCRHKDQSILIFRIPKT